MSEAYSKYRGGSIRSEALFYLDKGELTELEAHRLNTLTANQQGFDIYDDLVENGLRDYVHSVDNCLTLPKPPGTHWSTTTEVLYYSDDPFPLCSAGIFHTMGGAMLARTLPLAMLKAWWSIQPE